MKPSTLRLLLIATLLAVQLGTVALFAVDASRRVADELDANARAALAALAGNVKARSANTLGTIESRLHIAKRVIELGAIGTDDEAALERLFVAELESDERMRAVYIGRADGSFLSVARLPDGAFRTKRVRRSDSGEAPAWLTYHEDAHGRQRYLFDPSSGYDPRTRPWYRVAERSGGFGWTDPYRFFTGGEPGISAGVPLRAADGRRTGVLGADLDLRTLSGFIGIPGGGRGSAALVDDEGVVIVASGVASGLSDADGERLPGIEDVADAPLAALADVAEKNRRTGRRDVKGPREAEFERFESAGEGHLGLVLPFRPSGTPRGWSLLVQIPIASYAGAMADYFLARSGWLLGALLVLSLAAMTVILGVTAPVFRIHRDATVDRLTGVFVRAEFERRLASLLDDRRPRERDEQVLVAALDLDGFKAVNDTHGHHAGDEVLAEFARRLRLSLRQGDLVGRAGGDEFVMALRLPAAADVREAFERIRERAVDEPIAGRAGSYRVGVTIGVARRVATETPRELLAHADRALVDGKTFEKNRVYLTLEERSTAALALAGTSVAAANAEGHEAAPVAVRNGAWR